MRVRLFSLAALVLVPATAQAGVTRFGWLIDTDVLPERAVELQQWVADEDQQGPRNADATSLAWGPVVGVTDQVELALPVTWAWTAADGEDPRTSLTRVGAELRWRLVTNDPVDAPAVAPLIRVAVQREVLDRGAITVEADAAASYRAGRVHALFNVGVGDTLRAGVDQAIVRGGAGVSVGVTDELRVGAELFAQRPLGADTDDTWVAAGPDLAWTHGRFWLAVSAPIGLYQIRFAPRLTWAIAF